MTRAVDLFPDDCTGCFGCPGCAALCGECQSDLHMVAWCSLCAGTGTDSVLAVGV